MPELLPFTGCRRPKSYTTSDTSYSRPIHVVDAEDYPLLNRFTWFAEGTEKNYYAGRKENGKSIKMHRYITGAPDHLVVDHNGLNNRKKNLRLYTFGENFCNT